MNFRNCISFILTMVLLVSNAGLAFKVHYCSGSIASVSIKDIIAVGEHACCDSKATVQKMTCCKDKLIVIKDKIEEAPVKVFSVVDFHYETVSWKFQEFQSVSFSHNLPTPIYYCNANAPPLFKRFSQYILYA